MSTTALHESTDDVSLETHEMHRALASLIEELEAVDWYAQRVDATSDDDLKAVLAHNRDEEKEHACMTLEWIRRRDPDFDRLLRRFLFKEGPIVDETHARPAAPPTRVRREPTLGIGSLRTLVRDDERAKHSRDGGRTDASGAGMERAGRKR